MRTLVVLGLILLTSLSYAATATVTWTHDGVNTTGYVIERKTGPTTPLIRQRTAGDTYIQVGTTPAGTKSFVDPANLTAGTYCYRVKAVNNAVSGPYSGDGCGNVSEIPVAPNAPGTITITIAP